MNTLEQMIAHRDELNKQIYSFTDGFFYIVVINSYGSLDVSSKRNTTTVNDVIRQYNGDNGYVSVYTNNSEYVDMMVGGEHRFCFFNTIEEAKAGVKASHRISNFRLDHI